MKKTLLLTLALLTAGFVSAGDKALETKPSDLKAAKKAEKAAKTETKEFNVKDASYVMGYRIGFYNRVSGVTIQPKDFLEGYNDALAKKDSKYTPEQANTLQVEFVNKLKKHQEEKPGEPFSEDTSFASYFTGYNFGQEFSSRGLELDKDALTEGIESSAPGKKCKFSDDEAQEILLALEKKVAEGQNKKAEEEKKKGEAFLKENAKNPKVKTTASGLQYEVLTEGTGEKPKATDTVEVHYRGTLLNGEEFDSSYKRNSTTSFPLNGVIAGWTEGLQLMPVGSKYRFYIPSNLAYGDRGAGAKIPGGATLIFDVELVSIKK